MKQKDNMPVLVYLGLWGLNSRMAALAFVWLCVVLAAVSVALGWVNPIGYAGVIFLPCAAWYWYAIRWVDRHSSWD